MYVRPATLDDALATLARPGHRVLAGGTDVFPAQGDRAVTSTFVDLSRLAELKGIAVGEHEVRIGGAVTWSELLRAELPRAFDGLKAAAREVGSIQIQNAGTIAGNLCNASPAADGVPPLLALDAAIEIAAPSRQPRRLPLTHFITGYRQTALAPGEIVTAVIVPRTIEGPSCFIKLGTRRYLVISIAMVAAILESDADGRVARARLAIGACSPVAQRQPEAEAALIGRACAPGLSDAITRAQLTNLAPIDDSRATAAYRREAALELAKRAIETLAGGR
ncbi:MAG: FAD binding domain-containing protein [Hyphomicrobiaceae bacterium]